MIGPSLDHTLAALADPSRRRVVDLLRKGPRPAGELAVAIRMSAPAMSRHLRVLRTSGLVEETRADESDNRRRIYQLRQQPFAELHDWLADVESFWADQLVSFKTHAEQRARRRKIP
jgi:DNA-binding transcriptional ArsR family regulator